MPYSGITKNQGYDYNFFQKITVNWSEFGGSSLDGYSPDLIIPFNVPIGTILFLNEDTANSVQISFNGNVVHDQLDPTLPSKGMAYDNRPGTNLIWFKLVSGSSAVISVRAWARS